MKEYKRVVSFRIVKEEYNDMESVLIKNSRNIADFARPLFGGDICVLEKMFLITLNQSNKIVSATCISQGGISGTVVDVRLILKYALEGLATSVILVHNHPSGNLRPSEKDISITKQVKAALDICDIRLLDHIIITEKEYYSFRDNSIF